MHLLHGGRAVRCRTWSVVLARSRKGPSAKKLMHCQGGRAVQNRCGCVPKCVPCNCLSNQFKC
jgi:hypothetical protein